MKIKLIALTAIAASSLSAQSFVAGWDFDGVALDASSASANWGLQAGSATASWTHAPANPPIKFDTDFGISPANNSVAINNSFSFLPGGVDPTTGFDEFSDNIGGAEQGFQSFTGGDTFTLSFDGSGFTDLNLSYAFATDQGESFSVVNVDLSAFNGVGAAMWDFTPAVDGVYDNFAITGTVIPEASNFVAIAGVLALAFVSARRRS